MASPEVLQAIPQRPPFLFVDDILKREDRTIETSYQVTGKEDFLGGHFPGNPIVPGVILQEALFQSGALLMAQQNQNGLGVVTKVKDARFKNLVRPGDRLQMEVTLLDNIGQAYYFAGKIKVQDKVVLKLEFTCAHIKEM